MNLGLDVQAEESVKELSAKSYVLNEEEKKVNFEKIKALKDPQDDLKNGPKNGPQEWAQERPFRMASRATLTNGLKNGPKKDPQEWPQE